MKELFKKPLVLYVVWVAVLYAFERMTGGVGKIVNYFHPCISMNSISCYSGYDLALEYVFFIIVPACIAVISIKRKIQAGLEQK